MCDIEIFAARVGGERFSNAKVARGIEKTAVGGLFRRNKENLPSFGMGERELQFRLGGDEVNTGPPPRRQLRKTE